MHFQAMSGWTVHNRKGFSSFIVSICLVLFCCSETWLIPVKTEDRKRTSHSLLHFCNGHWVALLFQKLLHAAHGKNSWGDPEPLQTSWAACTHQLPWAKVPTSILGAGILRFFLKLPEPDCPADRETWRATGLHVSEHQRTWNVLKVILLKKTMKYHSWSYS